jgi:hypothetical protein
MPSDWSHEETDDPLHADRRNFYKGREVEQGWAVGGGIVVRREQPRQGQRIFERPNDQGRDWRSGRKSDVARVASL